jgi:hypothetical protein
MDGEMPPERLRYGKLPFHQLSRDGQAARMISRKVASVPGYLAALPRDRYLALQGRAKPLKTKRVGDDGDRAD